MVIVGSLLLIHHTLHVNLWETSLVADNSSVSFDVSSDDRQRDLVLKKPHKYTFCMLVHENPLDTMLRCIHVNGIFQPIRFIFMTLLLSSAPKYVVC